MKNLDIIRVLAVQKKIALSEVASRIGMSPQGLNKIINSNTTSCENLEKIAGVLGVPVGYFFDEEGDSINIGDGSPGAGKNNNVNAGMSEVLMRAFDEIAEQRRLTEKAQAQTDDLILILKSKML